jgi:hypothetical protein
MVYIVVFRDETDWIPIEVDSNVVTRIVQTSAVEFIARRANMGTTTRNVPRSGGVGSAVVARGTAYGNDDSLDDEVTLLASKFAMGVPLTDEDLSDLAGVVDVIATRGADWAGSYAIHLDNCALGATGGPGVRESATPFTSLYYALTHADTNASYTASANYESAASMAGTAGYDTLLSVFALYEQSRWYNESRSVIIAHPKFKKLFRAMTDNLGRPLFHDTIGETTVTGYQENAASRTLPQILDTPILWSIGAMSTDIPSNAPVGNPLLFVGNRDHAILGVRSGPETKQERLPGQDVIELMYRSRRGFVTGFPQAWSMLEYTGA